MKSFPVLVESRVSPEVRKGRFLRKRSAEERRRLLALFERSGLTLRQFSREHGVALSTLTYWRRRLRTSAPSRREIALVEVPPIVVDRPVYRPSVQPVAPGPVQIRLPNCVELNVSVGTDLTWVGTLLRELVACSG